MGAPEFYTTSAGMKNRGLVMTKPAKDNMSVAEINR
jgi:hypothetical protein